jgi:hypothetical protein
MTMLTMQNAAFCPERGWNPLSITEVHRTLEGLVLQLFHVGRPTKRLYEDRTDRS